MAQCSVSPVNRRHVSLSPNSRQIPPVDRIIRGLEMQQKLAPKIGSRRSPRTLLIQSRTTSGWCSPVATSLTPHGYINTTSDPSQRSTTVQAAPLVPLRINSPSPTASQQTRRPPLTAAASHGAGTTAPAVDRAGRGGAALAFAVDGAARRGATFGSSGGAGPGRGDERGVPQLGAQHVGLPAVRAGREQGACAGQAVLPGAGRHGGLQPRLPLRAPLRGRRLLRHRRRLRPRARAPRRLPRRHPAHHHMRSNGRLGPSPAPAPGSPSPMSPGDSPQYPAGPSPFASPPASPKPSHAARRFHAAGVLTAVAVSFAVGMVFF